MNVISIDPGTKCIGVYAYVGLKGQSFTVRPKGLSDLYVRLYNDTIWEAADFAFIEDFAFSRNGQGQRAMAEYVGVIKLVMEMKNVEWITVPISTWKVYTGRGLPKKKDQKYTDQVNEKYNKNFDTPDVADAFLIMTAMWKIAHGDVRTDAARKLAARMEEYGVFQGGKNAV
jgi:Holliday junction resolvasome RuvABC endonuclease subunit